MFSLPYDLLVLGVFFVLQDCRHKVSVREADDDERQGANSWKWTGTVQQYAYACASISDLKPIYMVLV